MSTDPAIGTSGYVSGSSTTWSYGTEAWCNLQGRYTHIVADLHRINDLEYSASICSLGVMGTKYSRTQVLDSYMIITKGEVVALDIDYIASEIVIATDIAINMRQSVNALSFVTLTEQATSTNVNIDTSLVATSSVNYLELESFNTLSSVQSTLKLD